MQISNEDLSAFIMIPGAKQVGKLMFNINVELKMINSMPAEEREAIGREIMNGQPGEYLIRDEVFYGALYHFCGAFNAADCNLFNPGSTVQQSIDRVKAMIDDMFTPERVAILETRLQAEREAAAQAGSPR